MEAAGATAFIIPADSQDWPANLRQPLDNTVDQGVHGIFDRQSGGFWDLSFLKGLPETAGLFGTAVANDIGEKARTLRAQDRSARPLTAMPAPRYGPSIRTGGSGTARVGR